MRRIKVISEVDDEEALRRVAEALEEVYGEPVDFEVRGKLVDDSFFNPIRKQYDAWEIVKHHLELADRGYYVLLITDKDIYAADLNYVFGLAWRGVAVVSTHRLRQEFYGLPPDRNLFLERLVKEAVHEVGHLHGLPHCSNRRCVMAFSNSIIDTDYKSYKLCEKCSRKLRRGLRFL